MTFTLYAATIPSFLQIIGATDALLDKASAWCAETGTAEADLVMARLIDDMLPFGYQVKSVAEHSLGAIEGVRKGVYSPDTGPFPLDFAGLRAKLNGAAAALKAIDPAEINGFIGQDMRFEFGPAKMEFTAEDFLLSFSLPNFYFHATTAYDILRSKGVKIGKRDFMGRPRLKG